jgi:hypothetical protein
MPELLLTTGIHTGWTEPNTVQRSASIDALLVDPRCNSRHEETVATIAALAGSVLIHQTHIRPMDLL